MKNYRGAGLLAAGALFLISMPLMGFVSSDVTLTPVRAVIPDLAANSENTAQSADADASSPKSETFPLAEGQEECPMSLPGTTAEAVDLDGGVAIRFTASEDNRPSVRQSVRRMADIHNDAASSNRGVSDQPVSNEQPAGKDRPLMPVSGALYQQTPLGGQMILYAAAPSQLTGLRAEVRGHVDFMNQVRACPLDLVKP